MYIFVYLTFNGWQISLPLFAISWTTYQPTCTFQVLICKYIVKMYLADGQCSIFSVHVAILMRWGVTIFKMPLSTAATVNQFQNPKVSIVKREEGGGEGQGGHLLFLIRMDQPFFLPPCSFLTISGTSFLFAPFQCFPPFSLLFYLSISLFCPLPWELNGTKEGCHFKMSPWQNKDPLGLVFFQYATSFHF